MFYFHERNKRPPLDYVNAMVSFGYSLPAGMCGAALEAVGLDPYVEHIGAKPGFDVTETLLL